MLLAQATTAPVTPTTHHAVTLKTYPPVGWIAVGILAVGVPLALGIVRFYHRRKVTP